MQHPLHHHANKLPVTSPWWVKFTLAVILFVFMVGAILLYLTPPQTSATVKVIDGQGYPVWGAQVVFDPVPSSASSVYPTMLTGSDGVARFNAVTSGTYRIIASKVLFNPGKQLVQVQKGINVFQLTISYNATFGMQPQ